MKILEFIYSDQHTNISLRNKRGSSYANYLNMKTRSILPKFWDKIVVSTCMFAFPIWRIMLSNFLQQKNASSE